MINSKPSRCGKAYVRSNIRFAKGSWQLCWVSNQRTEVAWGWPSSQNADSYSPMTAYKTKAES